MKKEFRVKRNEDFQTIIHKKKSVVSRCFVLYYLENNLDHCRVGISVSKKLGNAVVRNKIKRQVREMANVVFDKTQKYDYVVIVRNNFSNNTFDENKQDLVQLKKKIRTNH